MKKKCVMCFSEKETEEFYARDKKCKECRRKIINEYRKNNIDEIRERDRKRNHNKDRSEARKRYYDSLPYEKIREYCVRYIARNIEKRKAHIELNNAIKNGRIVKCSCEKCGSTEKVHGHHENYSRPLDVVWLCQPCHGQRHREINAERRRLVAEERQ